jgi:hypothetical protein
MKADLKKWNFGEERRKQFFKPTGGIEDSIFCFL